MIPHARDAEMLAHIKAWQSSGETQASYCQYHNLTIHQFIYYKQKLGFMKPRKPKSTASNQLVPVTIKPEIKTSQSIWIEHHNGFKVEFSTDADVEQLTRALSLVKNLL